MPLKYLLTIYFRKILTSLLWEMKNVIKILITFFFLFPQKLSLIGLLINTLGALVSIALCFFGLNERNVRS